MQFPEFDFAEQETRLETAVNQVEANGTIYCCAHCAEREGVTELQDRAKETIR